MFEFLAAFLTVHPSVLVMKYGPFGLFVSSLLGSTIFFPFAIELVFLPLLKAGVSQYSIVLYATLGSVIGTYINYLIGVYGIKLAYHHESEKLERMKKLLDRYGWPGLLAIFAWPLPLPVDPLSIFCGIAKMEPKRFLIVVSVAKIIRYSLAVGLFSLI